MPETLRAYDPVCKRTPEEIPEYVTMASKDGVSPSTWVRYNDGTYNTENGHFLCTKCYIEAGMPSSKEGWKCP